MQPRSLSATKPWFRTYTRTFLASWPLAGSLSPSRGGTRPTPQLRVVLVCRLWTTRNRQLPVTPWGERPAAWRGLGKLTRAKRQEPVASYLFVYTTPFLCVPSHISLGVGGGACRGRAGPRALVSALFRARRAKLTEFNEVNVPKSRKKYRSVS